MLFATLCFFLSFHFKIILSSHFRKIHYVPHTKGQSVFLIGLISFNNPAKNTRYILQSSCWWVTILSLQQCFVSKHLFLCTFICEFPVMAITALEFSITIILLKPNYHPFTVLMSSSLGNVFRMSHFTWM